jgi:hypothetical protein
MLCSLLSFFLAPCHSLIKNAAICHAGSRCRQFGKPCYHSALKFDPGKYLKKLHSSFSKSLAQKKLTNTSNYPLQMPATIAYSVCAFFGIQILLGLLKVKKLDQQERLITGTA